MYNLYCNLGLEAFIELSNHHWALVRIRVSPSCLAPLPKIGPPAFTVCPTSLCSMRRRIALSCADSYTGTSGAGATAAEGGGGGGLGVRIALSVSARPTF